VPSLERWKPCDATPGLLERLARLPSGGLLAGYRSFEVRCWAVTGLAVLGLLLVAEGASAAIQPAVHATLTSKVPSGLFPGARFTLTWTVMRPNGRPFSAKSMYVRVVCPEGDRVTTASAMANPTKGSYRAVVTVPAGGIGMISIGTRTPRSVFAITNPVHR
jgi:hypothetical protein